MLWFTPAPSLTLGTDRTLQPPYVVFYSSLSSGTNVQRLFNVVCTTHTVPSIHNVQCYVHYRTRGLLFHVSLTLCVLLKPFIPSTICTLFFSFLFNVENKLNSLGPILHSTLILKQTICAIYSMFSLFIHLALFSGLTYLYYC